MASDNITRLPPPTEPLRTAPATGVPIIKREKERNEKQDDTTPEDEAKQSDPEDEVAISVEPLVDFDHPDAPDAYFITLTAIQDLLIQHRANYVPADFINLSERVAFLQSHNVATLYWPPNITLQDAITQACAKINKNQAD